MFRKIISILIAFTCLFVLINEDTASAAEIDKSRIINVVYDDSGSMFNDNNSYTSKWSQAKYAMEIFAGMMGENDELNIYPICAEGQKSLTVFGSENAQARVDKIHRMSGDGGSTPYGAVEFAYQELKDNTSKDEKWLIVLTDGQFSDANQTQVQADMEQFVSSDEGLRVAYMTIGSNVTNITANNMNIYTFEAKDSADILDSVTDMGNLIFNQTILPDDYIVNSSNSVEISFDVPMEYIAVFAQGKDVSVGDVSGLKKKSEVNVVNSEVPNSLDPSIIVDENLSGTIVHFIGDGGDVIPDGTYNIPISNTDNVTIYYKPKVDLNLVVSKDGQVIGDADEPVSGQFDLELQIINPITNQPIESELLNEMQYYTKVDIDSDVKSYTGKKNSIEVVDSLVKIECTADMPGCPTLYYNYEFDVRPSLGDIDLKVIHADTQYEMITLEDGTKSIKFEVYLDGELIEKDMFDACNFDIDCKGLEFDIIKNDADSTIEVFPKYNMGNEMSTKSGDIDINCNIELEHFQQKTIDNEIVQIYIEPLGIDYYWKWILLLLIIIFLIVGYINKGYLPRGFKVKYGYEIRNTTKLTTTKRPKYTRILLNILPFTKVYAKFNVSAAGSGMSTITLKVRGVRRDRYSFELFNQDRFNDDSFRWGSQGLTDQQKTYKVLDASTGKTIKFILKMRGPMVDKALVIKFIDKETKI